MKEWGFTERHIGRIHQHLSVAESAESASITPDVSPVSPSNPADAGNKPAVIGKEPREAKKQVEELGAEAEGMTRVSDSVLYSKDRVVGRGAFGVVYRGICTVDGELQTCAVKKIPKHMLDGSKNREVEVLAELKHEHIVDFYGYEQSANSVYIVTALCDCNLKDGLGQLDDMFEASWQLMSAIDFVHEQGFAHRDLKPENVLLKGTSLQLADFGLAKNVDHASMSRHTGAVGTLCWASPEVVTLLLNNSTIADVTAEGSKQADIFSLGCLMYFMLTRGKHPFNLNALAIVTGSPDVSALEADNKTEPTVNLIRKMLEKEPSKRPGHVECLQQIGSWRKVMRQVSYRLSYCKEDRLCIGSDVFKAVWNGHGKAECAAIKKIKIVANAEDREKSIFGVPQREIDALMELSNNHPNIIRYFGYEPDPNGVSVYIVTELCDCNLKDGVERLDNVFQASLQLVSALSFMHERDFAHRNLKPENVLLKGTSIQLADFGAAKNLSNSMSLHTGVGALGWASPEVVNVSLGAAAADFSKEGAKRNDIFSLGCLIYYILTRGNHPFNLNALAIVTGSPDLTPLEADRSTEPTVNLIRKMLEKEPSNRPTHVECLQQVKSWRAIQLFFHAPQNEQFPIIVSYSRTAKREMLQLVDALQDYFGQRTV